MNNRKTYAALAVVVATTLVSASSWADNCGNNARAQLPACVKISTMGGKAIVQNTCTHVVDVKFDRRNGRPDSRRAVNPGETVANYDVANFYWCCTVGNCANN